ncbi:hypothetical protein QZH41_019295 [Actinostola sp. cb2023]|nr:hypothetical protein QZH41_019295 [Actinostola sp. cb2023]
MLVKHHLSKDTLKGYLQKTNQVQ